MLLLVAIKKDLQIEEVDVRERVATSKLKQLKQLLQHHTLSAQGDGW